MNAKCGKIQAAQQKILRLSISRAKTHTAFHNKIQWKMSQNDEVTIKMMLIIDYELSPGFIQPNLLALGLITLP